MSDNRPKPETDCHLEQLLEWAAYLAGRGSVWTLPEGMPKPSDVFRAHAAALEELARVKKAISESCDEQRGEYFGCRRAERAEAALATLKGLADALAAYIEKNYQGPCPAVLSAYRAEFKE